MPIDSVYAPPPAAARAVSVGDYGAVGDGVTDDSAAFRKAAAAAHGAGAVVELDAKRYALYSCIDLSGLHALQWRGHGHASVVVLRGDTDQSAFCATNTNDLAFRGFDFDGSLQAPVDPTSLGGFGIDVQGGTTLDVQEVRAYRTNRAVVRAFGCNDVYIRRIGIIELGGQQPDPQLNCDTMGIRVGECERVDIASVWGRDFPNHSTQIIRCGPKSVVGGTAITDVLIRGVRYFRGGTRNLPAGLYGGGGISVIGYPSQGNVAHRCTITDYIASDLGDSVIWAMAQDIDISQFVFERTGGIELHGKSIRVANGVVRDTTSASLWIHTDAFDPSAAHAGNFGPIDVVDVQIDNVLCAGAPTYLGGCLFDNGTLWNVGDDTPPIFANIQIDNLKVTGVHRDGLQFRNIIGTLQLGRVVLEDTCRSHLADTCVVAAPGTNGTSPLVPVNSTAGWGIGDWFSANGAQYRPPGGARIGSIPDATHLSLTNDAGDPTNAPIWVAGTTLTVDFAGNGALTILNDAGQAVLEATIDDLVVRDTGTPVVTPTSLYVSGWSGPFRARLSTFGAIPAPQAWNGSTIDLLPGSRLNGVEQGLLVPQTAAPRNPASGRTLWQPAAGVPRAREPLGRDAYVPVVGPLAAHLVDDFAGAGVVTAQVGAWGWQFASVVGGSGGHALTKGSVLGRPGTAILDTGALASNVAALYTGPWYASDDDATWEFLLAMMVVDANGLCRAGVSSNPTGANPPASGWWIERDYAGSAWFLKTSNATVVSQQSLGVTPTSGGYALLRLRRSGGTVYGSVGSSQEYSLATNIMSNAGVGPFVHAGQNNGVSHPVRVDRVSVEFPSLNRY